MTTPPTVDVVAAAEMMKASVTTVYKLIADGVIPAGQLGASWVMLTSDVLKHIEKEIINQTADRLRKLAANKPQVHARRKRIPPPPFTKVSQPNCSP